MGEREKLEDLRLQLRVMDRLVREACLDTHDMQIRVSGREACLLGWVRTEGERAKIIGLVRDMPGIAAVVDRLQLAPRPSYQSDAAVAEHVRHGIGQDADIDIRRLRVRVLAGDVLLTGWVADAEQARNAEANAWWTPGVLNVINHLHVGSEAAEGRSDDRAIAETLLSRLIHSPRVETRQVGLAVEGGVVTLSGMVPCAAHGQAADEIARTMPGVSRVVNHLEICDPA